MIKMRTTFLRVFMAVLAGWIGSSFAVDYRTQGWNSSTTIKINTTDQGAGIQSTLTGFPLLVRLSSASTVFQNVQTNGADLRFTNSKFDTLPYEIERFDKTNSIAEIWVKVDTIKGNNSTQFIYMFWNNAGATAVSNPLAVFDTSSTGGFAAVYHMGDDPSTQFISCTNRAALRGNIRGTMTVGQSVTGNVGKALSFDGVNDYASVPHTVSIDYDNTVDPGITLSAWIWHVDSSTVSGNGPALAIKRGNSTGNWYNFSIGGTQRNYNFLEVTGGARVGWNTWFSLGSWHLLTAKIDRSTGRMYTAIDGYIDGGDSTAFTNTCTNTDSMYIGGYNGQPNFFYKGNMDELRVERVARSNDWIKMCYENQKTNQRIAILGTIPYMQSSKPGIFSKVYFRRPVKQDTLSLTNTSGGTLTFTSITHRSTWISSITPTSGTTPATIVVSYIQDTTGNNTDSLDTIVVVSNATNSPFRIPVLRAARWAPQLYIQVSGIGGTVGLGKNLAAKTFSVQNIGYDTLKYSLKKQPGATWYDTARFNINHTYAIVAGFPDTFQVNFNTTGLAVGSYRDSIIASSADGGKDTMLVTVNIPQKPKYSYIPSSVTYITNIPLTSMGTNCFAQITLVSGFGTADSFRLLDSLPTGLIMTKYDGRISGNPTVVTSVKAYRVMSINVSGFDTTSISIDVIPPSSMPNPVSVKGKYVDSTHIKLTVGNYSTLTPGTVVGTPHSVGVWFKESSYVLTQLHTAQYASKRVQFNLTALLARGATYDTTITVPVNVNKSHLIYYLSASTFYSYNFFPARDSIPEPKAQNLDSVIMTVVKPSNNLQINAVYMSPTDSGKIQLSNIITGLDTLNTSKIAFWWVLGDNPDFSDHSHYTELTKQQLFADTVNGIYTKVIRNPLFAGAQIKVSMVVICIGPTGLVSDTVRNELFFGNQRPANQVISLIATALSSVQIQLQWTPVDSVRIWYGKKYPVPLAYTTPDDSFELNTLPSMGKGAYICTLQVNDANTIYYFGAQSYSLNQWTAVTIASSDTARTASGNIGSVPNKIVIDSAFLTPAQTIQVFWRVDTALALKDSLRIGYSNTFGSYSSNTSPDRIIYPLAAMNGNFIIDLNANGKSILFDTTYYISMWMGNLHGFWAQPVVLSRDTVRTGHPVSQLVNCFPTDDSSSTLSVFNGNIVLKRGTAFFGNQQNVVRYFQLSASQLNGFIPMSTGIQFDNAATYQFWVGFKYGTIPAGQDYKDLRVYRVVGGLVYLTNETYICDTTNHILYFRTNVLQSPIIAMFDTLAPVITFTSNITQPIPAAQSIQDDYTVSDNAANTRAWYMFGRGEDVLTSYAPDTLNAASRDFVKTNTQVSEATGTRIMVVATDGINTDSSGASRQVRRTNNIIDDVTTTAMQWSPLSVSVVLDSLELPDALSCLKINNGWNYDDKVFRIFRWYPTPDNRPNFRWVEYDKAADKGQFRFLPGRLIWIKTAEAKKIDFHEGVTLSLDSACNSVTLFANDWTDFALPYRFDITVGDILAATGADANSIQIYAWNKNSKSFITQAVYNPGVAQLSSQAITLKFESYGYSINYSGNVDRPLIIPPIPVVMSQFSKALYAKQQTGWEYFIASNSQNVGEMTTVYCGSTGTDNLCKGPMPPGFNPVFTTILDEKTGGTLGTNMVSGCNYGPGFQFTVSVVNNSDASDNVTVSCSRFGELPAGMEYRMFDPSTGLLTSDTVFAVAVDPQSSVNRSLLVGNEAFFGDIKNGFKHYVLGLERVFPNPFTKGIEIRYSIPNLGIKKVGFTVHDILGRMVFKTGMKTTTPGLHTSLWDGCTMQGKPISSGVYILRMHALDARGNQVKTFEQRLTYMPQ